MNGFTERLSLIGRWTAIAILWRACVVLPAASEEAMQVVQQDWLRQADTSPQSLPGQAQFTWQDAAGAVDGVKNGQYAFHTAQEQNPWWQVDLGQATEIGRVVVYNRLDYAPGLHNADTLTIHASNDGQSWTQVYDNAGKQFGGVSGSPPLEVKFQPGQVKARWVRLQIPSAAPIYFHLDEVEVYGRQDPDKNQARGRPADQSSKSQWSTAKAGAVAPGAKPSLGNAPAYPTAAFIKRGRLLALDLRAMGVDTSVGEKEIDACETALQTGVNAKELYLRVRLAVRRLAFSNPLLKFNNLLFVKRFGQETYPDVCLNHMPWVSRPGGDICVLTNPFDVDGKDRKITPILDGKLGPGHVHGADLWWDGTHIVFGYAKSKTGKSPQGFPGRMGHNIRLSEEPTHIYEIGLDGQDLRQLTDSKEWSDLDPTYLPNGDVCFVSERCGFSLQCNEYDKDETSCNLYVMKRDGSGIKRLSVSKDGDYLPHTLDDGTVGYTRWEYHERGWANIQSLWTIRPDGTYADAVFKQHFNNPWAVEEARSIPGSQKLVAVATGHHTLPAGPVIVVNPSLGINNEDGIMIVTPGAKNPEGGMSGNPTPGGGVDDHGGYYMQPWPLSERYFLASYSYGPDQVDPTGYALYYLDVYGNKELIYRDPNISCFSPMPLRPRFRPPVLPDTTDPSKPYAICMVNDATQGAIGIKLGQAKYLRIAEPIGWPYDSVYGGQRYETDAKGQGINWTPIRVLGTVPIEADGSIHFRVPTDEAVYFQLLDENYMELRRMRSFISFQKGENRGCVGCHETQSASLRAVGTGIAFRRAPSVPEPPPWGDRAIGFLRDIQPVLDRHCVKCHSGLKPAGGCDFSGGLTDLHNRAYDTIIEKKLIAFSDKNDDAKITLPMMFGSHKSRLIAAVRSKEHKTRIDLPHNDWVSLVTWVDANGPYHDGFLNKRLPRMPYDLASGNLLSTIREVHNRRCANCHKAEEVTRLDWIDLQAPAQSRFLIAPLAKEAGGKGTCMAQDKRIIYASTNDLDYRAILDLLTPAVNKAWAAPRRDLASLKVPTPVQRALVLPKAETSSGAQ